MVPTDQVNSWFIKFTENRVHGDLSGVAFLFRPYFLRAAEIVVLFVGPKGDNLMRP